jgi:CBS domain-containing protein
MWLSERVSVRYLASQTVIFEQGDDSMDTFFVVYKGAVDLVRTDQQNRLIDQLDAGDVFGLRPIIAKQRYAVQARTSEETLLYVIPFVTFGPAIDTNPRVARFLATSFAAGVRNPLKTESQGQGRVLIEAEVDSFDKKRSNPKHDQLLDLSRVSLSREVVTCAPTVSIKHTAEKMTGTGVGSIVIVDENGLPQGIVTDRDFRKKVITGLYDNSEAIEEIMVSPVVTIAPNMRSVDVQLAMVKNRIHHLVVTEDGTADSKTLGVISNHDLLMALGSSPAAIVAEIESANTAKELERLRIRAEFWLQPIIDQRGSTYAAASIINEINDCITNRCIILSLHQLNNEGVEAPELAFCWLALGSHGRGEQLLRTDQDHAIVIANGEKDATAYAKTYYLNLADRTADLLAQIGFERCAGDMMSANPDWCLTLEEWHDKLENWTSSPTSESILNASTLLDRRPIFGDMALGEELAEACRTRVKDANLLLAFMAKAASDNPPPLSFFRSFVVERGGGHKDQFDIKQRAMLPLADAARILSYSLGISDPSNTVARFDRLRETEPQNANIYLEAAQAYDTLMYFRARQGLSDGSDGRYFKITELSKLERLQLRNTFRPVEELLTVLKIRFQLKMLNQ